MHKAGEPVPYQYTRPGFESLYCGDEAEPEGMGDLIRFGTDDDANRYRSYSLWGFAYPGEDKWTPEIRALNGMQAALGPLDENTRLIRRMIGGLVGCDNGVPVTIDEILAAIGSGVPPAKPFHAGCWMSPGDRTTQPGQVRSMRDMEDILRGYLDGWDCRDAAARYPHAAGFAGRVWQWLGPRSELTPVRQLMLERMLLSFEWFAKRSDRSHAEVHADCQGEDGQGRRLDRQIEELAGLPPICARYRPEYRERLTVIDDEQKRNLYTVACHIADCCSELSDCHHSLLRRIEKWIHGIGTGSLSIPTQTPHAEGVRLGRLFFGYALGLDRWLSDTPLQFLMMDLSHIDLGFDPWPDIQRVYAHLGEDHSPVKQWLAGCLWFSLALEPPASLYKWGWRHREMLEQAGEKGVDVRTWMTALTAAMPAEG